MQTMSLSLRACITTCLHCYTACIDSVPGLGKAGEERLTEARHLGLLRACAEMCCLSAAFMLIGSPQHKFTCQDCAELCEACALACEQAGLTDCATACRGCARSCARMAERPFGLAA